ncbi:probable sugar phosphate/phosphate translocator At1g06470 [Cynara cardunculus var. scolymus]|uniref:probable sugar phosphate/phosphate translocator At1g06470 n=1 Tax=Cynara cardunculus var. scolymus TaxID=59895 RepID=UPI000D631577|nr:probable sugar phosphate/phosphate translocator At1g06470 [Cynara cardunculus var. scolymus]
MVESDLNTGKTANNERLGFQRDPSFSGWCDKDGIYSPIGLQEDDTVNTSEQDDNFELPVLQEVGLRSEHQAGGKGQHSQSQLHGSDKTDMVSTPSPRRGNKNENHASFDIEYAYDRELDSPNTNFAYKHEAVRSSSNSPFAISDILKTLFFILMWYIFSTSLTLYNKTLLGDDMGRFPAPLLMNTVHFTMQAVLSRGITYFWSQRSEPTIAMSWKDYFMRVVPMSLATALDVNLSNASLVFISVSFATMCKSASPIFLLIFAFAFRLETPSVKLLGIILIISFGILLTVAKETAFEFWGFIFVMLAAVMSGFRWSMTQILLQKEVYGLKNPLKLMSYVAPVMAVATALFSLIMDPWDEFRKSSYFDSSWHITRSGLLMLLGGTLAFFMVLTEYILVSVTSAVTVTIAGVVKEAVTILVAVFYFHDEFTWLKGVGLFTIIFGVSLFNWYKYQKLQNRIVSEDDTAESGVPAKYVILEDTEDMDDEESSP